MQRRLCSWPQEVLTAEVLTQKASLRGTGEPSWSWGEVLTLQWIDWFMNYPRSILWHQPPPILGHLPQPTRVCPPLTPSTRISSVNTKSLLKGTRLNQAKHKGRLGCFVVPESKEEFKDWRGTYQKVSGVSRDGSTLVKSEHQKSRNPIMDYKNQWFLKLKTTTTTVGGRTLLYRRTVNQ